MEYQTQYGLALQGKGERKQSARELLKAVAIVEEIRRSVSDRDVFFGGGGYIVDLDLAALRRVGPFLATVRLNDRVHLPGLALLVGQRSWADVLGDTLSDNLSHQPNLDLTMRWPISPRWQPVWAVHGELLVPLDSYVTTRGYVRSHLGVALPGQHGELLPFVAIDVGAGPGLLVNRDEFRLALGVRYGPN